MLAPFVVPPHASAVPRLDQLDAALTQLSAKGLLREPDGALLGARSDLLLACSNDYLGLGAGHVSRETPLQARLGAGASRLVHGTHPEHLELEAAFADWVGKPAALLFSSGYAANVGTLAALCDRNDLIVSDRLNHASLVDGCRLSRATVAIVEHCDTDAVARELSRTTQAQSRWVVVESYYSMDGDSPNLARLRALCDDYQAHLYVDEAHALGVFGAEGAGRCAEAGVAPDVLVGTLGKSLGHAGAFVAGSDTLRRWLWNRARSFVFSTGTSPMAAELLLHQLRVTRAADSARAQLTDNAAALRAALAARWIPVPAESHGPIVPVLIGDAARSVRVAERLLQQRILVQAIRPPTVPEGTARLRITVTASMTRATLERIAAAVADAVSAEQPA